MVCCFGHDLWVLTESVVSGYSSYEVLVFPCKIITSTLSLELKRLVINLKQYRGCMLRGTKIKVEKK